MFRAYRFRLEPNVNQLRELEIALETHRRLYNACLEQRKTAFETEKKAVKYVDQSAWFNAERGTNSYFARLNFSGAQATMRRLDKAFTAFFRRVKAGEKPGYPRFKSRDHFDSFTYPSVGDGARIIYKQVASATHWSGSDQSAQANRRHGQNAHRQAASSEVVRYRDM
jgi:putative transposase